MMKRILGLTVLALLAFSSCSHEEKVPKPSVFLDEQQMIDVLTDSYLIEAELTQMKSDGKDISALQNAYYRQLFEHYGINDSVFEQNMAYYTYHPAVLERVMDSVTQRFLKAQEERQQ